MHHATYDQPLLFELAPLTEVDYDGKPSIAERFAAFHAANGHVYAALRDLALRTQAHGIKRWSINAAFEILRWQYAMQTYGDEYKLNNDFRAPYARLLMQNEPRLAGFFETRTSAAGQ